MIYSLQETQKLAEKFSQSNQFRIFALKGEVGVGKTTFSQKFIQSLGYEGIISSPTFNIFFQYPISNNRFVYHFDCYRLNGIEDVLDIGLEEILSYENNIVLIEWPEIIQDILDKHDYLMINFEHIDEEHRKIIYEL